MVTTACLANFRHFRHAKSNFKFIFRDSHEKKRCSKVERSILGIIHLLIFIPDIPLRKVVGSQFSAILDISAESIPKGE